MTTILPSKVNELNEAEEPAKELLRRLGYTYVPREALAAERNDEREVLLKERLRRALLRLNPWMDGGHAERVLFALQSVDAVGMARNQAVHEYFTYGMPLDVDERGGRVPRNVRFFDFDHPRANEFIVTTQMRVRRAHDRGRDDDDARVVKPDLVLFVNGIPLVVMEAKSPQLFEVWKTQAVKQLLRYQEAGPEWQGTGAPELFDYNLLCVALCGAAAAYGAVGAHEHQYAEWKSIAPYSDEEFRREFATEPKGQAQLIAGLLAPATLLDVMRDYVVFEAEKGRVVKKLPRYQQYRAVTKAMDRVLAGKTPPDRGGVVWHTQGSGKSLTMLFLATKLRRESRLRNPTIVIVTDRTQLDTQITQTFERCGFPAPEHADSTRDLRQLLTSGAGRTVMTTIQKFQDALNADGGALALLNNDDNVFVMVDEAHRTQYGPLGARMEKALPNAVFIGFTGTPIDKGFKRSTFKRFGPLIDQYTIPQSVNDGATVEIYYEARLADLSIQGPTTLDRLFDALFSDQPEDVKARIRRRYGNKEALAEAAERIKMIALDIAEHYKTHIRPNGFKAQVVAPSRAAAVKYAEHLRDFGINAFPIITTTNDDGAEFQRARGIDHGQIVSAFKDPAGDPELLVVVDMLLTGFDAPIEQVLYLDRGLREHALLQAIARVNRRCTLQRNGVTVEKDYGLVVDYYGVSRELEQVLSQFDAIDLQGTWKELEHDPAPIIESAARAAEHFFGSHDLGDVFGCAEVFIDADAPDGFREDLFEDFQGRYRDFAQLMDRYLPNAAALDYQDRLTRLTRIRAYVRAQFLRIDGNVDWGEVSAKVKELIDSRIEADVRELMKPVSILDQDFSKKVDELPHDEARASLMEHAIRAQIKERLDANPALYQKLSEQLKQIIDEMRARLIDAAEAVRRLRELKHEVENEQERAQAAGMSELSLAVYELIERAQQPRDGAHGLHDEQAAYRTSYDEGLKAVSQSIEDVMQHGQDIVDWQNREDVQRVMRRDIKRELRKVDGMSEDDANELARQMVEMARQRLAR